MAAVLVVAVGAGGVGAVLETPVGAEAVLGAALVLAVGDSARSSVAQMTARLRNPAVLSPSALGRELKEKKNLAMKKWWKWGNPYPNPTVGWRP